MRTKIITAFHTLFLLSTLVGCGQERTTTSSPKDFIGSDDRVSTQQLSDRIGMLAFKGKPLCTAFISGANQITTAAHCIGLAATSYPSGCQSLDQRTIKW